MITKSNIALLQLIFDIFVLSKRLRRCESRVFHCVPQITIPFICSFINWLVLTILNANLFKFIIKYILLLLVTAEVNHFEVCLCRGMQRGISTFVDISFQQPWPLILLWEIQVLKIQRFGEIYYLLFFRRLFDGSSALQDSHGRNQNDVHLSLSWRQQEISLVVCLPLECD